MITDVIGKLDDWSKERGVSAVLRERLEQARDDLVKLKAEHDTLQKAHQDLISKNQELTLQLAKHTAGGDLVEFENLLWRRRPDGQLNAGPFCRTCRVPLSVFDQDFGFYCHQCKFQAGLEPRHEAEAIARYWRSKG